ncbi:SpaA isopeptide-forming pilin-related protein, partial [Oscillibacter sp.]|uniref:SpaA isopeptide-forming pilin-related protein n=1 Tax=Oscillibacter sp. TaxID=1945593 RepID=UPI0026326E84
EPSAPAEQPSTPSEEPSAPAEQPSTPAEQPSTPVEEPSTPAEEPSVPSEEPSTPAEEPSVPSEEPGTPTEEPGTPTEEPATPSEEPSVPAEEPASGGASTGVEYVTRTETWTVIVTETPPMLTGSAEYEGTVVNVSVPEGAFEEMPKLVILPVVSKETQDKNLVEKAIDAVAALFTDEEEDVEVADVSLEDVSALLTEQAEDVTDETPLTAFNITFYQMDENGDYVLDENGERIELQPSLPIDVEFSMEDSDLMDDAEDAQLQVYHVDSKVTEATAVDTELVDDTTAKVEADTFSIYAITVQKPAGTTVTMGVNNTMTLTGKVGYYPNNNHSWSIRSGTSVTLSGSSDNTVVATATATGTTEVKHTYYTSRFGTTTEIFTINVAETVVSVDTGAILQNGNLTANLKNGVAQAGQEVTYTWYRSESGNSDSFTAVTRQRVTGDMYNVDTTGKNLNAALDYVAAGIDDDAARLYYYVVATAGENQYTSGVYQAPYYMAIQNGSFESGSAHWSTTSAGGEIEIGQYTQDIGVYGTEDDKPSANAGEKFAELNAEHAGSLYQDVLTQPGSDLSWQVAHRARNAKSAGNNSNNYMKTATDTMYVVIMSTVDAEKLLAGVPQNQQQAVVTAMITRVLGNGTDATGHYTLVTGDGKDQTVTATVRKVTTTSELSGSYWNGYTSENQWEMYDGQYKVPAGQYATRFFFVAGATQSYDITIGNLIDNVWFSRHMAPANPGKGNLTVTKEVTGVGMDADMDDYSVAVGLTGPEARSATITNFRYNETTMKWVGSVDFSNLTLGAYTINESVTGAPEHYTANGGTTSANANVTDGGEASATLVNNYAMGGGMYTVSKVWAEETSASTRPGSISVQLYDEDGEKEGSPVTLNAANLWTYTWYGLDNDDTYYARETAVPDGYQESYHEYEAVGINEFRRITEGDNKNITVSSTSAIVAKRTGQSPTIVWTAAPLSPAEQADFATAFSAKNPSMKFDVENASFISGMHCDVEGITFTAGQVIFAASSQWSMVASGSYTPAGTVITNTYHPYETYTFTKTWNGNTAGDRNSINVTISSGGETYTGTVTAAKASINGADSANVSVNGNVWTITASLPKADSGYTISESKVNGLSVTNGVAQNGDSGEWVVTGGNTALINTYWAYANSTTSDTVTLNIHKTDKDSGANLSGAKFQVYEGAVADNVKVGSPAATDASGNATITLNAKDLKDGAYTLYEETTPSAAYPTHESKTFTVDASAKSTETSDNYTITTNTHYSATISGLSGNGGSYTVDVTNQHAKGTLSIEKRYFIDDATKIPATTTVSYGTGAGQSVSFAKADFTYNAVGGYYSASKSTGSLNTGSYRFSENRPAVTGYTGQTRIADGSLTGAETVSQTVTLGTGVNTVVVENRYARTTHSLTVTKNVTWDTNKSQAPATTDTFALTVVIGNGSTATPITGGTYNNNGALNATYTFTISGNRNGAAPTEGIGAVTITGVPYGVGYRVVETGITSTNRSGYASTLPVEQTGTMSTENASKTVVNPYFKSQLADEISVTKTWKEWNETKQEAVDTDMRANSITVGVYVGNELVAGTEKTLTATDSWTTAYTTLPKYDNTAAHNEIQYTVKETAINGQAFNSDGRVVVYGTATVSGSNPVKQEVEGYWTTIVDGTEITNTYYPAEAISDTDFKVLKVSSANNGTTLAGVVFTLRSSAIPGGTMEATTDENGIATFQNLMPGDYTLVEKSTISGYEKNETEWSFTVAGTNGTLKDVKAPREAGGNLFQNIWDWVVGTVTGTIKNYDATTKTATVENTPIVTGLTKQVYTEQYTATNFDASDYATESKWSDSASWTTLPANTDTVTALFKVTVTGTAGASYTVGDTMTIDGKNVATLVSGNASGTINANGDAVVLYYTATIPVTTTFATYTNTATHDGVTDATATVAVAKNDYVSGNINVAKTWNHGSGDMENSTANKAVLDNVTFQVQRKTAASDWENVTLTSANLMAGPYNANVDNGLLVLTTTDGTNALVTLTGLLMEAQSDLAPYTYRVTETKIAGTAITDGKALGYTNDGPQEVISDEVYIANTYNPTEIGVEGATTSFTVNKTDGISAITSAPAQFTLTKGDSTVSQWTTANGQKTGAVTGSTTFDGLTAGTYTLTETTAPAGYTKSNSSWQIEVTPSLTYTHNADGTVTVTTNYVIAANAITGSAANDYLITNTVDAKAITVYNTRETGALTITKTLSGETRADAANRTFGFTVTAPAELNGTYGDAHFTSSATSDLITVTGAGSVTLNNLPTSAGYADGAYTVSELYEITESGTVTGGAHINGYALSVYGTDGKAIANVDGLYGQTVTVNTGTSSMSFRNDYQLDAAQNEARFTIVKKSSDVTTDENKVLGGAIFEVYSDADCKNLVLTTAATDAITGVTTVVLDDTMLSTGNTFYLKEITPPTGYTVDETIWKINVNQKNADGNADVKLIQPDSGLFHDLYRWFVGLVKGDDTAEQNWTADTGIGESRTYGTLTVYDAPITTPDYTTETVQDDVTVQIRKTDSLSNETITESNAIFALTKRDTAPITATTENGVASHTFTHSDDGIYAITEQSAPDGYVLRTDVLGYVKVETVHDRDAWNADHTALIQYYKTTAAIYGAEDSNCEGSPIQLTEGKLVVTNQPQTSLQVIKAWADVNGETIEAPANASVTLALYRKAESDTTFTATGERIVLNGDTLDNPTQEVYAWVAEWKNLDPDYTYTAKEVAGFTDYTATSEDGWMVKHTDDSDERMTVGSITNQRDYGTLQIIKHVTGLQKNEEKTFNFTATDTLDAGKTYLYQATVTGNTTADGVLATGVTVDGELRLPTGTYTVTEESADITNYGLTTTVTYPEAGAHNVSVGTGTATVHVTNAYEYNPELNMDGISVTKVWNDGGNADGIRPESITVELRDNGGKLIGSKEIAADGDAGRATFTFDTYVNGYVAPYTAKEVGYTDATGYHAFDATLTNVPGYTGSGEANVSNDYIMTNTHEQATVRIDVEKSWPDGREKAVTLYLTAGGERYASVTLDGVVDEVETQAWKASFGEFAKNSAGKPVDYTVSEESLGDNWSYQVNKTTVDGVYSFTVINRYSNDNPGRDDDDDDDSPVIIPDEDAPTTDIPDESVPTTDAPTTDIPDEEVPLDEFADPTKTGDTLMTWILAAAVSGVGLVWLAISGKKRKDDNAR